METFRHKTTERTAEKISKQPYIKNVPVVNPTVKIELNQFKLSDTDTQKKDPAIRRFSTTSASEILKSRIAKLKENKDSPQESLVRQYLERLSSIG